MKYKINLFPPKRRNMVDDAVYFSFHYLRYILVITQIIVIGVFFYRFKIDQEIVDLKDALSQKQEIVAISEPLIKEVRAVEQKVSSVKTIIQEQSRFQEKFQYLLSVFPEKLTLDELRMDKSGNFHLIGTTSDPGIVKIFYERLKKDNKFKTVDLSNLKKDEEGFRFTLLLQSSSKK